ncbi:MAG TPA: hypothetical protein V6C78_27580 [Crinalium sp.]
MKRTRPILPAQSSSTRKFPTTDAVLVTTIDTIPSTFRPAMMRQVLLLLGLLAVNLSSCGSQPESQPNISPSSTATPTPQSSSIPTQPLTSSNSPDSLSSPSSVAPTSTSPSPENTTVTIYKADDECEKLIPETIQIPADRALEATVGKIINNQDNLDFQLGGYRISRDSNGVATVDLRLIPNPRRQIVSLSTCEQFALFGSLRETLTRNPDWNIKSVRFTERGKEIVF